MKRKLIQLISIIGISVSAQAGPVLEWLNPVFDFGAFSEDMGSVGCEFLAVNIGDEPVVVTDARANCGCTRPVYDKKPVAPGDTLRVSVSYDPTGRPGRFSRQVKITTNATGGPSLLQIKGTVMGSANTLRSRFPEEVGPYRISNTIAPFGEAKKGRVLAAAVNIYNSSADTIIPTVTDLPDYLNAVFSPSAIAPGEQGTLSLTAYTDRCLEWGVVDDSFRLLPSRENPDAAAKISTVIIVDEDFSGLTTKQLERAPKAAIKPTLLDFGRLSRNNNPVDRSFEIINNGRDPLLLRRVYTVDNALTIKTSTDKVAPGKSAVVTVSLNPSQIPTNELLNARITVISNDPASPVQIVRAVGEPTD